MLRIILIFFSGVGTMFKKVVPVKRYSSLDDVVQIGDKQGKKQSSILPALVERFVLPQ